MPDELLTVAQTAEYLKLSEKTIRRLIKSRSPVSYTHLTLPTTERV